MNEQQQILLDHYHNPRNFGKPESFTHSKKLQNLSCGDEVELFLTVNNETVTQAAFEGEGCSISIAAASLLTEKLPGMTLSDVLELDFEDMIDLVGIPLTTSRVKCAVLSLEAAHEALRAKAKSEAKAKEKAKEKVRDRERAGTVDYLFK
jgi:nitrogen fixation NifU-like protein